MYYGGRIGVKTFKEPLENQAALVYNLIRKVYRMQYPIALSKELFMRISILHFGRVLSELWVFYKKTGT